MQNDKVFARKDDGIDGNGTQKLRFDLIPVEPLRRVAEVYTIGAKKYADRNWEQGLQWGRVYAALQRHATSWWGGQRFDITDGQHHLASVVWCSLALMEYENTHPELDDRRVIQIVKAIEPYIHPKVASMLRRNEDEKKWCLDKFKQGTDPDEDEPRNTIGEHGGV